MKYLIITTFFLISTCLAKPYHLSWGQEYFSFAYSSEKSTEIYDNTGATQALPGHIKIRTMTAHYERGYPKNWNLIVDVPYFRSYDNFSGQSDQRLFGDIKVGARLFRRAYGDTLHYYAASFKFKGSDYHENHFNSPGDGQTDFTLQYIMYKQIEKTEFISSFGYTWRSKWPGNELPISFQMNYSLRPAMKLQLFYDFVNAINGHDYDPNDLRENEEDWQMAGIGVDYWYKNNKNIFLRFDRKIDGKNTNITHSFKIGAGVLF